MAIVTYADSYLHDTECKELTEKINKYCNVSKTGIIFSITGVAMAVAGIYCVNTQKPTPWNSPGSARGQNGNGANFIFISFPIAVSGVVMIPIGICLKKKYTRLKFVTHCD